MFEMIVNLNHIVRCVYIIEGELLLIYKDVYQPYRYLSP